MEKKIGIMGGTFNPIHNGHLMLAKTAFLQYRLDKVLFMPSKNPPHKKHKEIVSEYHRESMVKLAIDRIPYFQYSSMELDREGVTYTVDTLRELTEKNKYSEYYFIIGADSLYQIETWYKAEEIMGYTHILAAARYNLQTEQMEEQINYLNSKYNAKIHLLKIANMDISSDMIRQTVKNGENIEQYVDPKVSEYIMQNSLYK